ncbi:MAG: DUF937 domain-containing protein [Bacteroidota bacterium]
MADLLSTIMQSLGGDGIKQMSKSLGVDEKTAAGGVEAALPLLVSALARNSQSADGAQSLHKALEKDHDGSILDNLGGLFSNPQSGNGAGILNHLLGGKRQNVEQGLSKTTGMNTQAIGGILEMLAPMVLGALGRQQRSQNLDQSGLAGLLGGEQSSLGSAGGLLSTFLDSDKDGSILDDLGRLAGGLFGPKKQ